MNAVTEMPAPLVFTDNAAGKVKQLIEEEGNAELKLRVFVSGGGCSGFQYGFTFDEVQNDDDTVMQKDGVTLLIDPMSYQYLVGAEIDYQEGARGRAVRDQEPERHDHLRLRVLVLGLAVATRSAMCKGASAPFAFSKPDKPRPILAGRARR
jgi:iron-sulfur cluster insertion protein